MMKTLRPVKPARLTKGDLIGIVSPSSPIADVSRVERGVRYIESLGYRVKVGNAVGKVHGYLAGTDEDRARDLHEMFADREVKAIICVRGGYGTPRLLSLLDYQLVARNPKIVVGFSDVTALQLALWRKCRLITFHGPMAGVEMANTMDAYTEEMFWRCLTSNKKLGLIFLPDAPRVLSDIGRSVRGRLLGGNLALVVSLVGTRFQPDFAGSLLFLEEIGEEPYRLDRMLTQLRNASVFAKANGMLLGHFTDCVPSDRSRPSFTADEVLKEAARLFGKPAIAGLPFGHVPRKLTLPVGLSARLNTKQPSLEFLESAVH